MTNSQKTRIRRHDPTLITYEEVKSHLLSDPKVIFFIDLNEISQDELNHIYNKEIFVIKHDGCCQGLCLWFTCDFPGSDESDRITLSCDPSDPATHWKQTVSVLQKEIQFELNEPMGYQIDIKRNNEYFRRYDITFEMLDPKEVEHSEPCDCYFTKCIIVKKMIENYEKNDS